VVHLPALLTALATQLEAAGRLDWSRQECAHMVASTRAATRDWDDTRGAGRLDERQRAVLRATWQRREELARERDVAPQRLLRDKALVDVAATPPADPDELVAAIDLRDWQLELLRDALWEAWASA
jgi:ribonuclease D